jgi:ABC-type sugar transport system substrate-binding protein
MSSRMLVAALAAAALSVSTAAGAAQASPAAAPSGGSSLGSVVQAVVNFFSGGQQAKPAGEENGIDVDQDKEPDKVDDSDHDGPRTGK